MGDTFFYSVQWPIIGTTADVDLYDDIDRGFSSTYKFDDDDWILTNDEGLVELMYDASLGAAFQVGRKNIKIIYTGGYDEFVVEEGYNDEIDFNEGGSALNATLDSGTYTATTLCTEIDTQLTAAGAGSYTVSYNNVTCKFTITKSAGTFQLLWNDGTNAATNVADLLGFDSSANDTSALTYTGDYSRTGIPEDLEMACLYIVADMYQKSKKSSEKKFGKASISESQAGGGTLTYIQKDIPDEAKTILDTYRRLNV